MQAQGELLKAKKNTLTHAELFELGDFIRERCAKVDGQSVYKDGYNDARIVEEFNDLTCYAVTIANVIHAREAAIGPLAKPTVTTIEALELRVATLETLVKGLTK